MTTDRQSADESCGAIDEDQLHEFMENYTDHHMERRLCQRLVKYGLGLLGASLALLNGVALCGVAFGILRLDWTKLDGGMALKTGLYIFLVWQPIASAICLLANRYAFTVLPYDEGEFSQDYFRRFLLTGFCCYADRLVNRPQANRLLVAGVLHFTSWSLGLFGAAAGASVISESLSGGSGSTSTTTTSSSDENKSIWIFWTVFFAYGMECCLCYFILKKLYSTPYDSGYARQQQHHQHDQETGIVEVV